MEPTVTTGPLLTASNDNEESLQSLLSEKGSLHAMLADEPKISQSQRRQNKIAGNHLEFFLRERDLI
jgi:hypothetical protein